MKQCNVPCLFVHVRGDISGNVIEDEIVPMQRRLTEENGWKESLK